MAREVGEIRIYDYIGEWEDYEGNIRGIGPRAITEQLAAMGDVRRIDVYINSLGGDMMDGISIFNILRDTGIPIHTHVVGVAASSASIIMMAGGKRYMRLGSLAMIHRAASSVYGNSEVHNEESKMLEKCDGVMAEIYASATGIDKSKCLEMMRSETWLTSAEAKDCGIATETDAAEAEVDELAVAKAAKLFAYRNPPEQFKKLFAPQSLRIAARYTGHAKPQAGQPHKQEGSEMPEPEKKGTEGAGQQNKAEHLTSEQVQAMIAEATGKAVAEADAKADAKVAAERQRCAAITAKAQEFGLMATGAKLIAEGKSESEAIIALSQERIKALEASAAKNPGPNPQEQEHPAPEAKAFEDAMAKAAAAKKAQMGGK